MAIDETRAKAVELSIAIFALLPETERLKRLTAYEAENKPLEQMFVEHAKTIATYINPIAVKKG